MTVIKRIYCAHCGRLLFKYDKLGKGKLHHLWKGRIIEDNSLRESGVVMCPCGNEVGMDLGIRIELRKKAIRVG